MFLIIMKGDALVNILHMKYAVAVAKFGSLSKASESLLIAQPNISRSIKELENDLGITIFERSARGMVLTQDGEAFINQAKEIIRQIDDVERHYKENAMRKQKFSISVPRVPYIAALRRIRTAVTPLRGYTTSVSPYGLPPSPQGEGSSQH